MQWSNTGRMMDLVCPALTLWSLIETYALYVFVLFSITVIIYQDS